MTAEVVNNVSSEVVPQETEAVSQQTAAPEVVETKPSPQKENFARLRKKAEQLEQELNLQKELNNRLLTMTPKEAPKEIDELDSISGDEYLNKAKIDRLVEKKATRIAEEIAKREAERLLQQHKNSQFLDRLKRQFSDFDEVVNPETLALLEEKNPELADTIAESKDPYKIGLQSYHYIKSMNLVEKAPEERRVKEVEKKIEENAKTTISPQVYEKRPMAQAFKITEAEKKAIYAEMMQYASQAG